MGIETDRQSVRPPGFTHSLLAVFALLATFYLKVPDTWIIPADALQGMVLGYLSHIVADMLTPAGVSPIVAVPLAFPPAYPRAAKRQSTGAVFMYGVVCLGCVDAAVYSRKQRNTLVFAYDQYPANAVQSFYKSPD
ncbi:membrane protein [Salmonella enterica subsp. arizonae]|nr:membrane protein [Salmonella enterica subsp. arizonae]